MWIMARRPSVLPTPAGAAYIRLALHATARSRIDRFVVDQSIEQT